MLEALLKDPEKIGVIALLLANLIALLKKNPLLYPRDTFFEMKARAERAEEKTEKLLEIVFRLGNISERAVDTTAAIVKTQKVEP